MLKELIPDEDTRGAVVGVALIVSIVMFSIGALIALDRVLPQREVKTVCVEVPR